MILLSNNVKLRNRNSLVNNIHAYVKQESEILIEKNLKLIKLYETIKYSQKNNFFLNNYITYDKIKKHSPLFISSDNDVSLDLYPLKASIFTEKGRFGKE